ncbi:hypothetical protein QUF92_00030 [Bacillus cereus]|nr:hypothetical protein [Bacillus cereus]MDM5459959.1 hypothetical protein [Bacillus cereus]
MNNITWSFMSKTPITDEEMEKAIYPVCSSFTELLNSLRDYDDE